MRDNDKISLIERDIKYDAEWTFDLILDIIIIGGFSIFLIISFIAASISSIH